ncbi:TPA: hypothetical protein WIT34_000987 [Neisseria meningitidis]|nr:MAG TPA: hypothetical protein [Bacteriophage sp.]
MKLDRELQRKILSVLTECFPKAPPPNFLYTLRSEYGADETDGNLMYLEMHGLVSFNLIPLLGGSYSIESIKPTEKAFDFLAEDGGLSAVLGAVTVRLDAETLRELVALKIGKADIPPGQKETMLQIIRTLPAEGLKRLSSRLIEAALDKGADLVKLLDISGGL